MDCIKDGIIGQIVGDALGLPVQFEPREFRDIDPVTKMTGNGAFDLPAGSWSDDSSLILATMDGLSESLQRANPEEPRDHGRRGRCAALRASALPCTSR